MTCATRVSFSAASTPVSPDFAIADSQGNWTGLDVDYCKAIAAAVLGDGDKVKYTPLSAQQRFTALQSGEIDVLSRNTTWKLTRDASLGLVFAAVTYFDGQGFMVPKSLGITSASQLDGAEVCVQTGTTTELNLADFFRARGMSFKPVVYESLAESKVGFFSGRCQVYTTDASGLASIRAVDAPNPDDYVILPEIISKEPWDRSCGGATSSGSRSSNGSFMPPSRPRKRASPRPMSRTRGRTAPIPSSSDCSAPRARWANFRARKRLAYQIIKAVGNYGEIFDRNVGPNTPLRLERGLNALWTEGGLMYAMPAR